MKVLKLGHLRIALRLILLGDSFHFGNYGGIAGPATATSRLTESLIGGSTGSRKHLSARGIEQDKGRVLKTSAQQTTYRRFRSFAFVGFNSDANELAGGVD